MKFRNLMPSREEDRGGGEKEMDLTCIKITKGGRATRAEARIRELPSRVVFVGPVAAIRAIFRDSEAPVVGFRGLRLVSSFRAGAGAGAGVLITRSRCQSR